MQRSYATNIATNMWPNGDNFEAWLTGTTLLELNRARGNLQGTRTAFMRYFKRGMEGGLLLDQLMDKLPKLFLWLEYSPEQGQEIVSMLKGIKLSEIGVDLNDPPDGLRSWITRGN